MRLDGAWVSMLHPNLRKGLAGWRVDCLGALQQQVKEVLVRASVSFANRAFGVQASAHGCNDIIGIERRTIGEHNTLLQGAGPFRRVGVAGTRLR